ncbi:Hypothetical protein A7982_10581 [Minicystis rosea]|nr:Hypothetical protein A7982_10581 [Minicystis rosea]
MICPNCRQDVVPIVRGVRSYCTSCGAPMPFVAASEAVNVAGQPAKVGGGIAKVLGWGALTAGMLALLFFMLIGWVLGTTATLYVGGFFAVLALIVALPLLFAGRKLHQAGETKELAARERAIFALAAQRRGVLTVASVARALEIQEDEADATLTAMAKRPDGQVSLEIDESGTITYVFRDLVAATSPHASRVRVGGDGWRVPSEATAKPAPRVIDAELIEEEAAEAEANVPSRRMTR